MIDWPAVTRHILDGYALPLYGDHGVAHWARVWENGVRLAEATGADPDVVRLFALFHDSRRVNEFHDPGHGRRGGDLARSMLGGVYRLDARRFDLLYEACRLHTSGLTEGDVTVRACWDADRLDLGRVGITPDPDRLCTDAGRGLIDWANARADRCLIPEAVLGQIGLRAGGDLV